MLALQPTRENTGMSQAPSSTPSGTVYIVGSGPGDFDLLTLRAARLIGEADAIVYDHLIADGVLELARPGADKIYAGKESSRHSVPQEELNRLLVRLARAGKKVVRLKGGDPFIFGRGGEEIETLVDSGIRFEVVPGVTAAAGCAAYAGIPLTHRDHAQSCVFVTGHRREDSPDLNWNMLVSPDQTVVIYMGVAQLEDICAKLIGHGRDPATAAAIVERATTPEQRVFVSTLAQLPQTARHNQVKAPALIVVGNVVNLHGKLDWFGNAQHV